MINTYWFVERAKLNQQHVPEWITSAKYTDKEQCLKDAAMASYDCAAVSVHGLVDYIPEDTLIAVCVDGEIIRRNNDR